MLGMGIQATAQGIRNPTKRLQYRIQVPLRKTGIQFLESGIHFVEFSIQECLGIPYMGRNLSSIKTIHQGHNTSFNSGE